MSENDDKTWRYLLCRPSPGRRFRTGGPSGAYYSNDAGNRHSPTVICAAITSRMNKAKLPTHVELSTTECDITKDSVVLLEQIRTIDKQRLKERVCHLDTNTLKRVNYALKISLELIT